MWLSSARPIPMTYRKQQVGMQTPVFGIVLHTTNASRNQTLDELGASWQALQFQSAHFAVDRSGEVAQYRSMTEVAWHIMGLSTRYIGIEHVATHRQPLTEPQLKASGKLCAAIAAVLGIPIRLMSQAGEQGIGVHAQFMPTGCGQDVFWSHTRNELDPEVIKASKRPTEKNDRTFHTRQFSSVFMTALLESELGGSSPATRKSPTFTA